MLLLNRTNLLRTQEDINSSFDLLDLLQSSLTTCSLSVHRNSTFLTIKNKSLTVSCGANGKTTIKSSPSSDHPKAVESHYPAPLSTWLSYDCHFYDTIRKLFKSVWRDNLMFALKIVFLVDSYNKHQFSPSPPWLNVDKKYKISIINGQSGGCELMCQNVSDVRVWLANLCKFSTFFCRHHSYFPNNRCLKLSYEKVSAEIRRTKKPHFACLI